MTQAFGEMLTSQAEKANRAFLVHLRVRSGREMHQDVHVLGRIVLDAGYFDLPLFRGGDDGINQDFRGDSERNFRDAEKLLRFREDARPDADAPCAAFPVPVVGGVHHASGREVRQKLEGLAAQVRDGGFNQFVEIVGKNFAGKAYGNAFRSLGEEQGEFDGKADRLLVPAVIGKLPFRDLRAEDDLTGEGGEARFNVAGGRRGIPGQDVAPVPLRVNEQPFLSQPHQRVRNGAVAVRVEFHRVPHDVRHFTIAPVVQPVHGVQDAALHGLEPVIDLGYGPFQDDVRGVIQKVVGIHAFHGLARGSNVGGLSHGRKY